mmetsp:Transcript_23352/g.51115  ORF Transcript_23352/g.51115 Transcript_23352/m.51115 type:complete len:89 (+) Transcript_23352:790-1056(+)
MMMMDSATTTVSGQERDDRCFLEQIPESELSTPEDCLQKRFSKQPEEESTKEGPSPVVQRLVAAYYTDSDGVDIEAHPTNENTPLLLS